jgi:hypothetical protein
VKIKSRHIQIVQNICLIQNIQAPEAT